MLRLESGPGGKYTPDLNLAFAVCMAEFRMDQSEDAQNDKRRVPMRIGSL